MATSPVDVARTLNRPLPADTAQWSMWITDARMLIEDRLGDLALLDQTKLDYVVREAVAAMVRRPDDATQVSVSVDDGQVSRTYQSGTGRVAILDEWWALLGQRTSSAFSVRPYGQPDFLRR